MKMTILGTGNAMAKYVYNTCLAFTNEQGTFLVDGGGGNTILLQLEKAGVDPVSIREIFVTHEHIDHLLGVIWIVRVIGQQICAGAYPDTLHIHGHEEVLGKLRTILELTQQEKVKKHFDGQIRFEAAADGEEKRILGRKIEFFDIGSTKAKQFGFRLEYEDGKYLTDLGDEPFTERERMYAQGSSWLLHEAFCLYEDRERFKPYEKHHSTVREACQNAAMLGASKLLLYHTEDSDIPNRKERYRLEGERWFDGTILVPCDLEVFEL